MIKRELELSTLTVVVITSFLGLTLSFKLFMFLINVLLGFGLYIDCVGPEVDGGHKFIVKYLSQHTLRQKYTWK